MELYNVKKWTLILLLNCDYKISTKSIANRIKQVLPNLISNNQTGFIKGRFIGENIRLVYSIIKITSEKNTPGLLLFLDFQKAFNTLEWSFIQKALGHCGFGLSIINWFECTLYHETESCNTNTGWSSIFLNWEEG